MGMDFTRLTVFLAVARHLSFRGAAKSLHLSQPAVSKHIQKLEAELGLALFERPGNRVALTEAGRMLQDYGQRVQNSVFECLIDPAQLRQLQNSLMKIIDPEVDSLRYYYLGDNWKHRVEHIGAKPSIDLEGTIIT